jgi:type I restriction enzyme S subunit
MSRKMHPYSIYKKTGIEWMDSVPNNWQVKPIKYVVTCNDDVLSESTPQDFEIKYVEVGGVSEQLGIESFSTLGFGDAPSRARRLVAHGDTIVSTVRTYLRAIAPVISPPENLVVSTGFAVIRPKDIHSDFARYLLSTEYFMSEVISHSTGVSYPAINTPDLMNIKVAIPSPKEQEAIAIFLNKETGKIDELIHRQEKLVAMLDEKCQTLISHAVTKGLNHKVKMKDSGVSWIGEIPLHWESKEIRRVIKEHKQGYYSSGGYQDEGLRLLRITDLQKFGVISYADCPRVTALPETEEFLLKSGDFVFARTGGAGSFGLVEDDHPRAIFASYLIRFRFDESVNTHFLKYLFLSSGFKNGIEMNIHGGVNKNVHAEDIKNQYISAPPLIEQQEIVDYLDIFTRKIQDLIQKSKASIELLKERRSSLISAAVTGKIDVREVA